MPESDSTTIERLALIASGQALASVHAHAEDLADPEVRAVAIRADHPELDRALREGREEIVVDGQPMRIRLHLTIHAVLAGQLADDDPPEVFQAARRLLDAGYERHEVLHMLASPMTEQMHAMLAGGEGYDRQRHLAALEALPGSWERQRGERTGTGRDPGGRHTARRRRR